jgi:hypothetical protein
MSKYLPGFPHEQTFSGSVGMLKRVSFGLMHRSKQLKLFDHSFGAGEQKMRDCDLAELARVKT